MTFDELEFEFGPGVRKIVEACTDATYEQKAVEKAEKEKQSKEQYEKAWWERKKKYLDRLEEKNHSDLSVLVALSDKVNNGEKSALDIVNLTHDQKIAFWNDNFNVGYTYQRQWYEGLSNAFIKVSGTTISDSEGNIVSMDPLQKRLVLRFTNAVSAMFN
jgi:hypothetical protein